MVKINKEKLQNQVMTKLWLKHSFLAMITSRLELKLVDSDIPAPAYTDTISVALNIGYIEKEPMWQNITIDNYVFLLAHEVFHILNFTADRKGNRNADLWNISADYVINASLLHNQTADGIANPIGQMPSNPNLITADNPKGYMGLYDKKYLEMTIEQVYDELVKEYQQEMNPDGTGQDQDGNGNSISISIGSDNLDPDKVKEWLKKHNLKPLDETFGSSKDLLESKEIDMKQQIKAIIENALNEMKDSGKGVDSAFGRTITELLAPPKMNWKSVLERYLRQMINTDRSWKRLSRRSWGSDTLLAGQDTENQVNIGIGIDTSGSIGQDELNDFLAHISKICGSFKSYQVKVWDFSTQVHTDSVKTYTKANITTLSSHPIKSYGGTDIKSNFDYVEKEKLNLDSLILMTDGYDDLSDIHFNRCPVIWAITENENFDMPKGIAKEIKLDL